MMMRPVYRPVYRWKRSKEYPERVYLYRNGRRIGRYLSDERVYQKRTRKGWGAERRRWPVRLPRKYKA